MSEQAKRGTASRLARLLLTSSDAELIGGQLYDIQGYAELVDGLSAQTNERRSAALRRAALREGALPLSSLNGSPILPNGPKRFAG